MRIGNLKSTYSNSSDLSASVSEVSPVLIRAQSMLLKGAAVIRQKGGKNLKRSFRIRCAVSLARCGLLNVAARQFDIAASDQANNPSWRLELTAGALYFLAGDTAAGSVRLSRGCGRAGDVIMSYAAVSSLPADVSTWIEHNLQHFSSAAFWTSMGANSRDEITARLVSVLILSKEVRTARAIVLWHLTRTSRLAAPDQNILLLAQRVNLGQSTSHKAANSEAARISAPDGDRYAVYDLVRRACRGELRASEPIAENVETSAEICATLNNREVLAIVATVQAWQESDYPAMRSLALAALEQAPPGFRTPPGVNPRKLLLGGFGWSGSSAVHDAFRGYPSVYELPGSGSVPHLNSGADSEPMYIQGPCGLGAIWKQLKRGKRKFAPEFLWTFVRLYVIGSCPHNYLEYKAAHATRQILEAIGGHYYYLVLELLSELALAAQQTNPRLERPFQIFSDRLVAAMGGNAEVVIFNNAINVDNIHLLSILSNATYVAVRRDLRDQFADQRRSNKFFEQDAAGFRATIEKKVLKIEEAMRSIQPQSGNSITLVDFEKFVVDEVYRGSVAEKFLGSHSTAFERTFFDAAASRKNVGIWHTSISLTEERILS